MTVSVLLKFANYPTMFTLGSHMYVMTFARHTMASQDDPQDQPSHTYLPWSVLTH